MKFDYPKLQQDYWELAKQNPEYSVQQFCIDNGLKYATARRYIKKLPTPKRTATGKPKIQGKATSQGNDWHSLLKKYLALAIKNPTYSIAQFAKDNAQNGGTLRREFKKLRSSDEFAQLFDLFDEQKAKLKSVKTTKGTAAPDKTKRSKPQARTHAPTSSADQVRKGVKVGSMTAQMTDDGVVYRSSNIGRPMIHGGYAQGVGLNSEILEAIMTIDPLSVANELVMARARYFQMNASIAKQLDLIDEQEINGTLPTDEDNKPKCPHKMRDQIIFGYAPRLRELEFSISSMVKQEQKRYAELRKMEFDEMMQPHLLPSAETQVVIELLTLRVRNKWTALETCQQIELLGAHPPPTLLHEAKLEMAMYEPEIDDSGVSEDELDAMFDGYKVKQDEFSEEWLAARRELVASEIQKAEELESGHSTQVSAADIKKAAQTEAEYDELAEREGKRPSAFDDLDSFEVLV